jgi:L-alanine-DL-glutamate epimerase-like enolase superfamily enzyme
MYIIYRIHDNLKVQMKICLKDNRKLQRDFCGVSLTGMFLTQPSYTWKYIRREVASMTIARITAEPLCIPLKRPFITALRTVYALENVLVAIHTDSGETAYGEAAAATAVTGETAASIQCAVNDFIAPAIIGRDVSGMCQLRELVRRALPYNPAAKAAIEAALFNLRHQVFLLDAAVFPPLPKNGITISIGSAEIMALDCLQALDEGFTQLKIKLGKTPAHDGETLSHIHKTLRERHPERDFTFRVDANGGWQPKEAVRIIRAWEDASLPVSWVEQPTSPQDINGLATVTRHTHIPIMADESVFTPQDAVRLLEKNAADLLNIKLAKSGGFSGAWDIAALCRAFGVPWMMGCMLESRLGASAAAMFAAAHGAFAIDLDGPLLCAEDPFTGGVRFDGAETVFTGGMCQIDGNFLRRF